jgi:hypothetical protein
VRVTLLAIVTLAAAVLAGCGSSGDQTVGGGFTVPSDVHGLYGEAEAILNQLPYQSWYTQCVVRGIRKSISPTEAEKLAALPEAQREVKLEKELASAGPECEESSKRPVIDPNASDKEFDLYRSSYLAPLTEIAKEDNFDSEGISCVEEAVQELPTHQLIVLGNGARKAREAILVSILTPCASGE